MKLFNSFSTRGYHTSIISTFCVDFGAFESIVLPRLRDAGCSNNILIGDARLLGNAMNDSVEKPKFAGRLYSVVGAQSDGVFHPKLILQLGDSTGRLIVASANMTSAGLAGNLEVVGEVRVDENDRGSIPILRAALEYLAIFLVDASIPRSQVEWAMERAHWLRDSISTEPLVELQEERRLAFLAQNNSRGIGERFVELVGNRIVKRLIVISPYWDKNLSALYTLHDGLGTSETAVMVQPRSALFPIKSLHMKKTVAVFDVDVIKGGASNRFSHAKVFIAETNTGDCVLYGSANCTQAALAINGHARVNAEACLYRELPAGHAVKILGLESALMSHLELDISDFPDYEPAIELPLEDLGEKLPGRFEFFGDQLHWWYPKGADLGMTEVVLFDQHGKKLNGSLAQLGVKSDSVAFRFNSSEVPYFARYLSGGFQSSLGIVIIAQAIKEARRGPMPKGIENTLMLLDEEDANEGLWLLDVIQKLDAAQRDARILNGTGQAPTSTEPVSDGRAQSRVLAYDQFVAGRKAGSMVSTPSGSQLASTHHESIRTFLNALVGKRAAKDLFRVDVEAPQFSMGDETSDGSAALDEDGRFDVDEPPLGRGTVTSEDVQRRRQKYVKDTQRAIVDAVEYFLENLDGEVRTRPLDVIDLLRLRAMLMIVLGAGSNKSDMNPREPNGKFSRYQVLPGVGDGSWRLLVGKLIYGFFRKQYGGKGAPIQHLVLRVDGEAGLPDDVLECWETCQWALCATRVAVNEQNVPYALTMHEERIATDLYRHTKLLPGGALGESLISISNGMSERYANRLGVPIVALAREHKRLTVLSQAT